MKKLGILVLIFALAFTSCSLFEEDSISKQEARAEKDRMEVPEKVSGDNEGNSYWFVVVHKKNTRDFVMMNTTVKQEHRYFSAEELKAEFKEDVFILNLVEISKETFEHNE